MERPSEQDGGADESVAESSLNISPPSSGCDDLVVVSSASSPWFAVEWNTTCHHHGAVAQQDIPPLTLIWTEQPILHANQIWNVMASRNDGDEHEVGAASSSNDFPRNHDEDDHYLRAVCGLTHQERKRFWHLHDQYNQQTKRIWGIILTNSFCNRDLDMEPTCFFVVAKAFNHSCAPNVGFDFSGKTQRLWTTRSVSRGEELTISYNDVVYHHPAPVRRVFLERKYRFQCACQACNAQTDTHSSDERRRRIGRLGRVLANSLGAWFLYSEIFEEEIQRVAVQTGVEPEPQDDVSKDDDDELLSLLEISYSGKDDKTFDKPNRLYCVLLDRLLEYMDLVRKEGIDHDVLECYELAYDTAVTTQQFETAAALGTACLERYKLQKGGDHVDTKAFRAKLWRKSPHLASNNSHEKS